MAGEDGPQRSILASVLTTDNVTVAPGGRSVTTDQVNRLLQAQLAPALRADNRMVGWDCISVADDLSRTRGLHRLDCGVFCSMCGWDERGDLNCDARCPEYHYLGVQAGDAWEGSASTAREWRSALVLGNIKVLNVRQEAATASARRSRHGVEGRAAVTAGGCARATTPATVADDREHSMSGAAGFGGIGGRPGELPRARVVVGYIPLAVWVELGAVRSCAARGQASWLGDPVRTGRQVGYFKGAERNI